MTQPHYGLATQGLRSCEVRVYLGFMDECGDLEAKNHTHDSEGHSR